MSRYNFFSRSPKLLCQFILSLMLCGRGYLLQKQDDRALCGSSRRFLHVFYHLFQFQRKFWGFFWVHSLHRRSLTLQLCEKSGLVQRLPDLFNNRLNEILNGLKLARIHFTAHGDPRNFASFLTAKCVSF